MSLNLYDGLSGITLFLSALYAITKDPEIKLLNESTIRSLRQGIENIQQHNSFSGIRYIGITSGISSIIYTFLKISTFLDDPSFIDDAIQTSRMIDHGLIGNDKSFDVISGSAGCILAMLLLFKKTGLPGVLEKAILCGDHLLTKITEVNDGTCGWITGGNKMLTGFSHGQAGIAYSLLKLFEATGEAKYRDIAIRAIDYENSRFSDEFGNWPDMREFGQNNSTEFKFMNGWCHGAPGIGLARTASIPLFYDHEIERNIFYAIKKTIEAPINDKDHICCGNMGRIEVLLYCAIKRGDEALKKAVYKKASVVIDRAEKNGHYTLFFDSIDDLYNPGFFQGMSGIGYEFLRLAYPDKIPSVLIFE
jgi:type 2 lantibiotic biosynthesis protein LanM